MRFDPTAVSPEAVARELSRPGLIRREQGGRTVITTQGVLAEEKAVLDFAREGRGRFVPLGSREWLAASRNLPEVSVSGQFSNRAVETDRPKSKGSPSGFHGFDHPAPTKPDRITLPASSQPDHFVGAHKLIALSPSLQTSNSRARSTPLSVSLPAVGEIEKADFARAAKPALLLSPSQQLAARRVLTSPDRLIVVRGVAGAGKSTMLRAVMPYIRVPWVILAPSVTASRGELRESGFDQAETLAKFLGSKDMQQGVRNGLIVLDEAGMAGSKSVNQLVAVAQRENARILLLGDRRQHKSPVRGDVLSLLESKGVPVVEVAEIKRQAGEYRKAVEALAAGHVAKGFDRLDALGWVKETDHFEDVSKMVTADDFAALKEGKSSNTGKPEPTAPASSRNAPAENYGVLVDDYLTALHDGKSALVISPTHAAGDKLSAAIRDRLRAEGKLGEDRTFKQLVPLHYTEAQLKEARKHPEPGVLLTRFGAYRQDTLALAPGDLIRTTAGVKDIAGKRVDNGTMLTVSGFTDDGIKVRTVSGAERILPEGVGHLAHGYVSTSHASQGRTVDIVLVDMTAQNLPAVSASQLYVSASRGRQKAVLYVDDREATRKAVHKQDVRPHASDLVRERAGKVRRRLKKALANLRNSISVARDAVMGKQQEVSLERT